jgi:glycosyltransferase involved in cell wall biosynthesis
VPVLGYDDGATPELVDEYSGLLIPDKNHQTIIDALDRFGSRDRDRQRIATRAKELLEE